MAGISALHKRLGIDPGMEKKLATRAKVAGQSITSLHGVTFKQEKYAQGIADGLSLTEAYRRAYDCENMSEATINSKANELSRNGRVVARIDQLMEAREYMVQHDGAHIRSVVLKYLLDTVQSATVQDKDRLKAAELLGKTNLASLFTDNTKTNHGDDKASLDVDKLNAQLRQLIADAKAQVPEK